jgi:hypothetical protein
MMMMTHFLQRNWYYRFYGKTKLATTMTTKTQTAMVTRRTMAMGMATMHTVPATRAIREATGGGK